MTQPIDYEPLAHPTPPPDTRAITAALKFIGYALLFLAGAVLTAAGTLAETIHPGPGALIALAGASLCVIVLILLLLGAAAAK